MTKGIFKKVLFVSSAVFGALVFNGSCSSQPPTDQSNETRVENLQSFQNSDRIQAFSKVVPTNAIARDLSASAESRAMDLLKLMTLEEKVGQMTQVARDYIRNPKDIGVYGLGSILSGGGSGPSVNSPEAWADMYDEYQRLAIANRLGIPMIYGTDAVHGNNNVRGSTIFPHNIGMGATQNPLLVEKAARITALEVAATGVDWTFAPCITVPQDIRWGRTYEGYSENSDLVRLLGTAAVRGFQAGSAPGSEAFESPDAILACVKHYIGDGGTVGGIDRGDAQYDESSLRSNFLAPYSAAIKEGAGSVMVSFSSWNGQKMHQNKYLVTEVLKKELNFKGFVVSDWGGVKEIPARAEEQIELAINAGIDMVMVPDDYATFCQTLIDLVKTGRVAQSRIDDAVLRILTVKFKMGLFERPFADRRLLAKVGSEEHRAVARQAVRESQVILKNDGILPIKTSMYKKILVAGTAAENMGMQCGGWTMSWQGLSGNITPGTTILDGIKAMVNDKTTITYRESVRDAKGFDLVIVVAGESPYAEMKGDSRTLNLLPADLESVKVVTDAHVPLVTVLLSGRPLMVADAVAKSRAFVAGFLPGTEGAGVAEVLFGRFKPSGKLSFTWPANIEAVPIHSDKLEPGVLFPRGWGLTW